MRLDAALNPATCIHSSSRLAQAAGARARARRVGVVDAAERGERLKAHARIRRSARPRPRRPGGVHRRCGRRSMADARASGLGEAGRVLAHARLGIVERATHRGGVEPLPGPRASTARGAARAPRAARARRVQQRPTPRCCRSTSSRCAVRRHHALRWSSRSTSVGVARVARTAGPRPRRRASAPSGVTR